jgi:hypothetical protein
MARCAVGRRTSSHRGHGSSTGTVDTIAITSVAGVRSICRTVHSSDHPQTTQGCCSSRQRTSIPFDRQKFDTAAEKPRRYCCHLRSIFWLISRPRLILFPSFPIASSHAWAWQFVEGNADPNHRRFFGRAGASGY